MPSISSAKAGDLLVDDTDTVIAVVEYCNATKLCTTLEANDRRWTWHLHRVDVTRDTLPLPQALREVCRDWYQVRGAVLTLVRA